MGLEKRREIGWNTKKIRKMNFRPRKEYAK